MEDPLRKIDATLKARGFALAKPPATYRGPVSVHGTKAIVEVDVVDLTFARLPKVKLADGSKLPIKQLAHTISGGFVCYHDGALVLDMYDPGGAILRVLEDVAVALERSFGGRAKSEFERELASYWQGSALYFDIPRAVEPKIIKAEVVERANDHAQGLVVIPHGFWPPKYTLGRRPATVICGTRNLSHSDSFPATNLEGALAYLEKQDGLPSGWRAAVLKAGANDDYLFISAPNAIIGWRPDFSPKIKALQASKGVRTKFVQQEITQHPAQVGLERAMGKQVDLAFCVDRNLAGEPSLIGKKVALIGCGTIGGFLARMLVQTGAGCGEPLIVYDTEKLAPGNLGRHLLGFSDLGKWKADAVAENLKQFHPDLLVEARRIDATTDWGAYENVDLVIDATGEPNVATALNDLYMRSAKSGSELALLHVFVFGNGVAGQSLLNLKDGHACYRCLKTSFDGQWRYSPLKDPSSPLREAPASCGEGGYVPFAVDAPSAAAGLALRAALDWAGEHPGARLRTVIVDHSAGRDKAPWTSPKPLAGCPACGEG